MWLAIFWVILQVTSNLLSGTAEAPKSTDPNYSGLFMLTTLLPACVTSLLIFLWKVSPGTGNLSDYFRVETLVEELKSGFQLFVMAFAPTFLMLLLSLLWKTPETQHVLLQMLDQQKDYLLVGLIGLGAVVVAPLFEELLFRILLLNGLMEKLRASGYSEQNLKRVAALVISILFCLGHGKYDALQLMPLALCLAWSQIQRKSYWSVVLAHAFFNASMLMLMLASSGAEVD
ncbi:CPBP family intramembrane glutamic endopeptidase [Rubinisphaera italica]|uniref:CAAX amino terminal protease self-immunity n=1 Tax=Rubinisphaera italica TaxID=2527969 RepID=A0A5C5XDD3_9PLAN|nr:CPBP family intramembrane glutamic endopeptidase [Rubinisphaera italica]TWT61106.1 CAAX amino terminal protease self- immunity [Rubinisphaera italica]